MRSVFRSYILRSAAACRRFTESAKAQDKLNAVAFPPQTQHRPHRAGRLSLRFLLSHALHGPCRFAERRLLQFRPVAGGRVGRRAEFAAQRSTHRVLHADVPSAQRLARLSLESIRGQRHPRLRIVGGRRALASDLDSGPRTAALVRLRRNHCSQAERRVSVRVSARASRRSTATPTT